jgi:hypothetical protein
MGVFGRLRATAVLPPRKELPVLIERETGWYSQARFGSFGEEQNFLPFPGIEPQSFDGPLHKLVRIYGIKYVYEKVMEWHKCSLH